MSHLVNTQKINTSISRVDKQPKKKKIIMLRFLYNMVLLSVMMVVSGEAKTMANTASLIFMSGNSQELGELLAWLSGVKYKN